MKVSFTVTIDFKNPNNAEDPEQLASEIYDAISNAWITLPGDTCEVTVNKE